MRRLTMLASATIVAVACVLTSLGMARAATGVQFGSPTMTNAADYGDAVHAI